tara:strand:+ start:540 stop:1097 length:558 start_codon:yes stop_codon:yes gene_type:complete
MKDTLKDKFLYFCAPDSVEDYFNNSLIFLCANDDNGSYGLIINRTVEIKLRDYFSSVSTKLEKKLNSGKIILGGPVQPMSVYVLYSNDKRFKPLLEVNDEISVSQDVNLIKAILDDDGPEEFLVSFGFTGWSKGQLENEILSGNWLITPSNKEIIFNTPNEQKINKVSKLAGFDLKTVSVNHGSS